MRCNGEYREDRPDRKFNPSVIRLNDSGRPSFWLWAIASFVVFWASVVWAIRAILWGGHFRVRLGTVQIGVWKEASVTGFLLCLPHQLD